VHQLVYDDLCTATCKSSSEVVWNCLWYIDCGTCLQDHIFYVMDYMSGGDLKGQLDKVHIFSEGMTQFYSAEITVALQYLHQHGIVHR
jgi:serine/threonine protein kinase